MNPLGARNWLAFGVPQQKPALGDVLVFWRGTSGGFSGHVGLYVGEDAQAFHVLGGNQSDAVTIAFFAKSCLLGARWQRVRVLRGRRRGAPHHQRHGHGR